jgi:hypothetical protein
MIGASADTQTQNDGFAPLTRLSLDAGLFQSTPPYQVEPGPLTRFEQSIALNWHGSPRAGSHA